MDSGALRRLVERITAPLVRRVRLMVGRAVLYLVDDARKLQELQVEALRGEVLAGVERFQQYGFSSNPLPGAEVLLLCVGGSRSHAIAAAVDDRRYRPTDADPGEVRLYTAEGDRIRMRNGRVIEVIAGTKVAVTAPEAVFRCATKVTLDTPVCEITGNLVVGGDAAVAGSAAVTGALSSATSVADPSGSMQGMRDTYNQHNHPETNQSGGNTGMPNQGM